MIQKYEYIESELITSPYDENSLGPKHYFYKPDRKEDNYHFRRFKKLSESRQKTKVYLDARFCYVNYPFCEFKFADYIEVSEEDIKFEGDFTL